MDEKAGGRADQTAEPKRDFIGYEYHSVTADSGMESVYTDGYENFGWIREDARPARGGTVHMKFKRDRKIRNKAELTRLQRQFEACTAEITALEKSRNSRAMAAALTIGLTGTAFIGGATFAYLGGMLPLMVVLAVPGFAGWILPYFCHGNLLAKRGAQIAPLIERKYDEIYEICEKASRLLA